MADKGVGARIAGAAAFVSMADGEASVRIAGAAAFVSMADGGASVRIAGAAARGCRPLVCFGGLTCNMLQRGF